jgi:hypothetical protein
MSALLPANGRTQLAVVTGGHTYEVPPFVELFRDLQGVDFYPQSLDEWSADTELAAGYDVVLFYTMYQFARDAELPWYQANIFSTLERLGNTEQGVLLLHHSLCAFPEWDFWDRLVGYTKRREVATNYDHQIPIEVMDSDHPITRGIANWTLQDETYEMASPRAGDNNQILLATSHPHSMSTLAWARTFGKSRVFCYQSGHDHVAFADENFRRVLQNAIEWLSPSNSSQA